MCKCISNPKLKMSCTINQFQWILPLPLSAELQTCMFALQEKCSVSFITLLIQMWYYAEHSRSVSNKCKGCGKSRCDWPSSLLKSLNLVSKNNFA